MSAPAPPTIPPRPVKQQAVDQGVTQLPQIPPRPQNKRVDRSISPGNFPRSPLNEPYAPDMSRPNPLLSQRPPSVAYLPTPGEEGMEYANVQYQPDIPSSALAQDAQAQKRTIAEDLHLHAPKPSLPKASATAQVQNVTRTDSASGARASMDDLTRTRSRQSFSRPDSAASDGRRRSVAPDELGPAELGLRVPINPLLGDVQAPTPQGLSPQATGESTRKHNRRKSGFADVLPPDTYGLHGHGVLSNDKFERDWYAKHPDQLEHEEGHGHGVYEGIGSGRGAYALSSDELNNIVRTTASRGAGFGTAKNIPSYPDEQIGYMASETYQRSQQNTPHPEPLSRLVSRSSQPTLESPLRRTSFPAEDAESPVIRRNRLSSSHDKGISDDEGHHIEEPARKFNKVTGGQEQMNETSGGLPYVTSHDEDGNENRIPILAEDEVRKSVGAEYMHPAVSPKYERRASQDYQYDHENGTQTPTSRPASRPGSIYQLHSASHSLSRFMSHQDEREHMHTPLEDVAEYEPLFEESEEKKAMSHLERFKSRPDMLQKRFPSQDIWEDTPTSSMYTAEVSTPDLPATAVEKPELKSSAVFEPPEAEHARKEEVPEEAKHNLEPKQERLAKSAWAPHLRDDMPTKARPALLANRFPSQDVWEDTPESMYHTTTVSTPEVEEKQLEESPVESKPPVPQRPAKSRLGEGASPNQIEPSVAPQIPARPQKKYQVPPQDAQLTDPNVLSKPISPPSIPERPKPQVPPRPKKADDELTKTTSIGSNESTDTQVPTKSKPQVPARPAGGISSLRGNFMNDLNKKLGLGPPKEKEPEPVEEAKPLESVTKSRARGPQRRAPAPAKSEPKSRFAMFTPRSLWHIDEEGELATAEKAASKSETISEVPSGSIAETDYASSVPVPTTKAEEDLAARPSEIPKVASGLVTNTAGEPVDPIPTGDDDNVEGELTRKTTASTIDGESLDRVDSRPNTHVLDASKQTTASDRESLQQLEKTETHEPPPSNESQIEPTKLESKIESAPQSTEKIADEEEIKVRNEQVNASAPADEVKGTRGVRLEPNSDDKVAGEGAPGEDAPKEPMNEDDVTYSRLEEMTALADGKVTASEDPQAQLSSRKVVE